MPEDQTTKSPRHLDLEARMSVMEASYAVLSAAVRKLDEIHAAVVGTPTEAGLGERVRALESFARAVKGVAMACATAVAVAWSMFMSGPKPPHP